MLSFLKTLLGDNAVLTSQADLKPYRDDFTEADAVDPACVAFVTSTEQVQAIVKEATRRRTPLVPRVYGTNVGGLAIPSPGAVVLDFTRMNQILEIHEEDMVAVIEPGVTQIQMKTELLRRHLPLTLGFSLAPPETSIFANALLGGLTNRSLKYGDQGTWIAGLEVVRSDGSLVRTGSWALADIPFGRVPFPDLTGLFIGFAGTTGIATKMAFQLWPKHPLSKRLFVLGYSTSGTFKAVSALCRKEICDDIGGLSWPSAKMMMGVRHPHPYPSQGEPTFFLYVDLTAEDDLEMKAKERILGKVLKSLEAEGEKFEAPLDVKDLVKLSPALLPFAEFPTELTFLTQHGGGGLSWIGTYGPLSRFIEGAERGMALMASRGFPPIVVSRPMRGGHFGVLRFVTIFDKANQDEVRAVRELNAELLELVTPLGFVMYKTPTWAWQALEERIDPGLRRLMSEVKGLMDPAGIFNPGKLGL